MERAGAPMRAGAFAFPGAASGPVLAPVGDVERPPPPRHPYPSADRELIAYTKSENLT